MPKAAARTVAALFVLLASLAWPAVGSGQEPTGFRTPGYGARRDIVEGPGNAMWFRDFSLAGNVDQAGAIQAFSVASDGPGGIAVGADGNLGFPTSGWNGSQYEARITQITTSRAFTQFALAPEIGDCTVDATTLCLNGGRFRVTADWKGPDGVSGSGRAVALTSGSGYFWFFDSASVEIVIKVLNGCAANQNYWVFGGGLTNVEVHTRITDTQTGFSKDYSNAQGTPFEPIQDTAALSVCP